ncbi:MAG: PAS domain S-box protein, partial [Desulfobacteraceae bacterium]|nr:PAS domain S-box protein [Desulfobacteraceae bacterium]
MIYTLYLLSLIASAMIAAALAYFLWRRRTKPGATPAVWMLLAVIVWSLAYILQFKSTTLSGQIFATNIQYFGIVTVPVMWFVFSLQYTGHDRWLTRRNLFLLAIVPFLTLVLAWTNGIDGLMWHGRHLETSGPFIIIAKTYGPWFWIHTSYLYLLILSGAFFLLQRLFRPPHLYRRQSIAILICVIVPLAWNVLYVFNLAPIYRVDLTPSAFVISGLAIAWGLFQVRLFDVIPVARDTAIESMSNGVVVLDIQNRFIDLNRAAERILGCTSSEAIGQPVADVLSEQPNLVELFCGMTDVAEGHVEVEAEKGETQYYYASDISPIYDRRGHLTGRLIILSDITKRKRLEEELRFSDAAFRSIQESIVASDTEFTIIHWNEVSERLYGIKAYEAIGKKLFDVIEIVETSPGENARRFKKLESHGYYQEEQLHRTKTAEVWVVVSVQAIENSGKRYGWVALAADITGRKQA